MDPGTEKSGSNSKSEFTGLENPPGVRSDEPGTTFTLQHRRGSARSVAAPPCSTATSWWARSLATHLPEGNGPITVNVFVRAPYDKWVRTEATRFWNASGLRVELGGSGVHVELESIQASAVGRRRLQHARRTAAIRPAPRPTTTFRALCNDEPAADAAGYKRRVPFVLYFQTSTTGLSVGSPVQLYGIPVGNVTDIRLELDPTKATARVRVAIEIQPERLSADRQRHERRPDGRLPAVGRPRPAGRPVDHQLYHGGASSISFEFTARPATGEGLTKEGDAIVLPTQGGGLGGIVAALTDIVEQGRPNPLPPPSAPMPTAR